MDWGGIQLARLGAAILLLLCCLAGATGRASAQAPAPTEGEMPPPSEPLAPLDPSKRLSRAEEQLRKLEERNRRLQMHYENLLRRYEKIAEDPVFGSRQGNSDGRGVPGAVEFRSSDAQESEEGESGSALDGRPHQGEPEQVDEEDEDEEEASEAEPGRTTRRSRNPRRQSGVGGAGQRIEGQKGIGSYLELRGPYQPDMRPVRLPVEVYFSEGLEVRTEDDFFTLEFHDLSQFDFRTFSKTGDALHDNFLIPRQRWYFAGQISPYAYYYTVINRGYGGLDILDSFVDLNFAPKYKEQLQLRVGRMKTPFTYEYIKISESDLIAAERSLFLGNFAGNRQIGVMAHGQVFEQRLEYFVGAFNGPRRSFQDYNNSKDVYGYLNFRPFLHDGPDWLKHLNLSGSINGGDERNPTQPSALTTANDQSDIGSGSVVNVSPTFLIYNAKAFENGARMQWGGDVAYYYKSFTMLANCEGGFQDYSLQGSGALPSTTAFGSYASGAFVGVGSSQRSRVPLEGWSFAATYFLTGEQITRRVYLTEPVRPFGWYDGRLNPGAIEIYSRFSNLQLGDQVFTDKIANPAYWANRANAIDTGVNWYLNHYVRIYFDWQHSMFNNAVFLSDTKSTRHEDLFWFRTQVFF